MKKQSDYSKKLLDPRWQKKRLEILQRDEWACKNCGDNENTLHIHHLLYKGENPWDIENDLLITLCEVCHYITENLKKDGYNVFRTYKHKNSGFYTAISFHEEYSTCVNIYSVDALETAKHIITLTGETVISLAEKLKTDYYPSSEI